MSLTGNHRRLREGLEGAALRHTVLGLAGPRIRPPKAKAKKDHSFISRDNLAKLQVVLLLVKSLGVPFIVGKDLTCLPAG